MQETYLITGATGFVGSNMVRMLVSQGKKVTVIVRDKKLNWRLSDLAQKLYIYECDLLSSSLAQVVGKIQPHYIFNFAVYGSLPSEDNIDEMLSVNIKGTINLINAVKNYKYKLFIHTGSSSEYGVSEKRVSELVLPEPINEYGITKLAATLFCQKTAKREKLPIIVFRLFSPYGYFEEEKRLVPSIILAARKNKIIQLSSQNNVRDFIFIEDVVNAYIKATKVKVAPGEIFNIGSGRQHSVSEVARDVLRITKSTSQIQWNKIAKQDRQLEPKRWEADIQKAKRILGWKPRFAIHTGLNKTIAWLDAHNHFYA